MRGIFNKLRNWLFVAVSKELNLLYCQLVQKRIRSVLETIIFQVIYPGTIIESDNYKLYYWLGKITTSKTIYNPMRLVLYKYQTVNYSKEFKAKDSTYTNKVE